MLAWTLVTSGLVETVPVTTCPPLATDVLSETPTIFGPDDWTGAVEAAAAGEPAVAGELLTRGAAAVARTCGVGEGREGGGAMDRSGTGPPEPIAVATVWLYQYSAPTAARTRVPIAAAMNVRDMC